MLAHDIRDRLSPRSDTAICPDALRFLLWACQLAAACNNAWNFRGGIFTLPHWLPFRNGGLAPFFFETRTIADWPALSGILAIGIL